MPTVAWKDKTKKQKREAYEAVKRWREKNRGQFNLEQRESIRLRRSWQYSKGWPLIVAHYGGKCLNCGAADGLCFDHVIPLSQGGRNELDNGQPLCRACNTFKGQIQEKGKDWRPDKGEWARKLVEMNPLLVLGPSTGQGSYRALGGKAKWEAIYAERQVWKVAVPGQIA